MSSEINIEEIERFLEGKMDDNDRSAFEKRIAEDADLAQQVEIAREMDGVFEDDNAVKVMSAIQAGANDFFEGEHEKKKTKVYKLQPFSIAASLAFIVLCGLVIWWQLGESTLTNQELYAANYEVYEVDNVQRSEDPTITDLDRALSLYAEGKYEQSSKLAEKIIAAEPQNNRALYLLGHAKLNMNPADINGAISSFEKIAEANTAIEADDAKWYLALIYLEKDDIANAKKWLVEVKKSEDAALQKKAVDLLEQLD